MNADASKFSLQAVEQIIKPHAEYLPFKRLSDYVNNPDIPYLAEGVVYHLELWPAAVRMPASADIHCKAYIFSVNGRVKFIGGNACNKPMRIEHDNLIMLYPAEQTILWLFQRSRFVSEKGSAYRFCGTSSVDWVNEQTFTDVVHPPLTFPERFWGEMKDWIQASMEVRRKTLGRLDTLHTRCVIEWSKLAAEKLVKDTAVVRQAYAVR